MKILALTLALFTFCLCRAQITTSKIAEAAIGKYDSTENYVGKNAAQYIGQELYLKGLSEGMRQYGYPGFILDYTKNEMETGNRYKNGSITGSPYAELVGKYFIVLDVIKGNDIMVDYFLKLREKSSGDTLYYMYEADHENAFPFTVTGYFLKQKQLLVGKKYVIRGLAADNRKEMKTGLKVSDFTVGKVWTVTDITIDESFYDVSAIVENSKHESTLMKLSELKGDFYVLEYDKMIKCGMKPGDENWQLVANLEVRKGMTKAMCELSLGKPRDITKKTFDGKKVDMWNYDTESLFFENGLLYSVK